MATKKGTPVATVKIWTDDLKIVTTAAMGDSDSEVLSITTTKDLTSPTGTFTINFVPRPDAKGQTWFDKLDAFDYVEISFQGINDDASHLVMRGLIDKVVKTENWEGGAPDRTITVTGRDLASMFTDHGIYFMPELGGDYATMALLGVVFWGGEENYEAESSVSKAFDIIIGHLTEGLDLHFGGGQIDLVDNLNYACASTFPNNATSYGNLQVYQGDFWNCLAWYADKPFHELFLYDDDNYSNLILRPARLKDAMGNYHNSVTNIMNDASMAPVNTTMYPPDFTFSDVDMIQSTLEKNHNEVYNYILTYSSVMMIEKVSMLGVEIEKAGGDPTLVTNPFFQVNPNLPAYIGKYGFRKYEGGTVFKSGPNNSDVGQTAGPNSTRGENAEEAFADDQQVIEMRQRNQMVIAWFLHNEHLLSGTIDIAGTNRAIIGTYAKNTDDNMEYYVGGVTHNFVQFRSFRTSLRVERGMPSSETYGLVGLSEYRYSKFNRFYFNEGGVWDTNPPIIPVATPEPKKLPKKLPKVKNLDRKGVVYDKSKYTQGYNPGQSNF